MSNGAKPVTVIATVPRKLSQNPLGTLTSSGVTSQPEVALGLPSAPKHPAPWSWLPVSLPVVTLPLHEVLPFPLPSGASEVPLAAWAVAGHSAKVAIKAPVANRMPLRIRFPLSLGSHTSTPPVESVRPDGRGS